MISTAAIHLTGVSHVDEARRQAVKLAAQITLNEAQRHQVGLVVTELATNLIKHARSGYLVINAAELSGGPWLQVISIDRGPGIEDTRRCFEDGYSTAGSPGTGLGAVRRLAQTVDMHSIPGTGTVIAADIYLPPGRSTLEFGAVSLPCEGETACGDAWDLAIGRASFSVAVADGLGHGPLAAVAAQSVVEAFGSDPLGAPHETLERMHEKSRPTRGAAAAVALLDDDAGVVRFAGVGNIAGMIVLGAETRRMVSHHGTLGHVARRFSEFEYPVTNSALIILHSDGIGTRWSLDDWPRLARHHPAVIAGVILRDQWRLRDDATVFAIRRGI